MGRSARRVVFATTKYWRTPSQLGLHFVARSFRQAGWDVLFLTTHMSWIAASVGQRRRLARVARREANRPVAVDGVTSYVWYTPWQPVNLRLGVLNRATGSLFRRYGDLRLDIEPLVAGAARFVFDSGSDLLLFERFKRLAPRAAFVYRVSDDLRSSSIHPVVLDVEAEIAPRFDLVSVPCRYIAEQFPGLRTVAVQHHGVDRAAFDAAVANPYARGAGPNAVFVGNQRLDTGFIDLASAQLSHWTFHVIGSVAGVPQRDNVRAYGSMPFADTIGYVKHADVGLHTIAPTPGALAFTDSLKVIQYTYCRLPIVVPAFLGTGRPNFIPYTPGDARSIRGALERALAFDRRRIDPGRARPWDDLADDLGRRSPA
jgi:2-beta-glucuronyltransferase